MTQWTCVLARFSLPVTFLSSLSNAHQILMPLLSVLLFFFYLRSIAYLKMTSFPTSFTNLAIFFFLQQSSRLCTDLWQQMLESLEKLQTFEVIGLTLLDFCDLKGYSSSLEEKAQQAVLADLQRQSQILLKCYNLCSFLEQRRSQWNGLWRLCMVTRHDWWNIKQDSLYACKATLIHERMMEFMGWWCFGFAYFLPLIW